ncbi:hypothetical protein [Pontimicrobium sp. IMCC45349]|uniref:hypothetical protein n=1 Tax=Pontimicrobium sp. IMCC45349 TaxID=3391574 RepID=UPI0039A1C0B3
MFKTILGVLFYILGLFFILSFIGIIIQIVAVENFIIDGPVIAAILLDIFLAYVLLKYAIKWTIKKKHKEIPNIDDIGKSDV